MVGNKNSVKGRIGRASVIDNGFAFVLYGLDSDNGDVRAEVFAQKVVAVIKALRLADREVNRGKRHELLIADLQKHSAQVKFRERVASRRRVIGTGSSQLATAFSGIYQGGTRAVDVSPKLIKLAEEIASGAEETFSHGEAIYADNVIRIDQFFISQAKLAQTFHDETLRGAEDLKFVGVSIESFDGSLRVIDGRGQLLRAMLTLSAGGTTIECVFKRDLLPEALAVFKKRVSVEGLAIYDGARYLPRRIEVTSIRTIQSGNLLDWRGKFRIPSDLTDAWPDTWQ